MAVIDGLDEEHYHRIHVGSIWNIFLPEERSDHILEAIRTINDSSVMSTVSAFESDQYLSMSTSLELPGPVEEAHIEFALLSHIGLANRCIGPLLDIAFRGFSVDEIARLFKLPSVTDMH